MNWKLWIKMLIIGTVFISCEEGYEPYPTVDYLVSYVDGTIDTINAAGYFEKDEQIIFYRGIEWRGGIGDKNNDSCMMVSLINIKSVRMLK